VILIEIIDQEEEEEAEGLAVEEEILADGKCTKRRAPSAEKIVKFRFSQEMTDRYTAVIVLRKGEVKIVTFGDQVTETLGDQSLKREIHAVETANN
jgi:hypothetical protein